MLQMGPNSEQSESDKAKKPTDMSTLTVTKPTSGNNSQKNRSSSDRNLTSASDGFIWSSGAVHTANTQCIVNSNSNGFQPSRGGSKKSSARRRNRLSISGQILLTMLLSSAYILEANSFEGALMHAIQSPTDTTVTNNVPFFNTSTTNVSAEKIAGNATTIEVTTQPTTAVTKAGTPVTSYAAPPSLSENSAATITNVVGTNTILSAPVSHPMPLPQPPPSPTSMLQPAKKATTILPTSELRVKLFTMDTAMASTRKSEIVEGTSNGLQPPPSSEVLIKGFSIPTFLPPFPAFAMADLPAYTMTTPTSAATVNPTAPTDSHNQLYLAAYQQNAPRHNLSMSAMNITVQMGNHAYLPCNIHRLLSKPISWVRLRDGHILSVDQATFIADQRFQSIFQGEDEYTWSLQIKYVQDTDEGWYECQVSTEPKMSAKVYLGVVVPHTELIGDQTRYVKAGSKVALHCIVRDTLDPPTFIIWLRDKAHITNDNKWGWYTEIDRMIFGNADSNRNTIGSLIIPFVRKKDSGNYTCQPSNSAPVSVDLHVLSGEYSASAIMSAASSYWVSGNSLRHLLLSLALLLMPKT